MNASTGIPAKDGRWYVTTPVQKVVTRKVYANLTRRNVWAGRVMRWDDDARKWVNEICPHGHDKKNRARLCAKAAAGRLNTEARS